MRRYIFLGDIYYFTITVIISSFIILSSYSSASGQNDLWCGKEIRIETADQTILQGKLLWNNGETFALKNLGGLQVIYLVDVTHAYHIRSMTEVGIAVGMIVGGLAGFGLSILATDKDGYDILKGNDKTTAITILGSVLGAMIGWSIGHSIQGSNEIQLGSIPICRSPLREKNLLKVKFAINF